MGRFGMKEGGRTVEEKGGLVFSLNLSLSFFIFKVSFFLVSKKSPSPSLRFFFPVSA